MEIDITKSLVEKAIKGVCLNEDGKEMWSKYLKALNGEQLEFIYHSIQQDSKFLARLTKDILKKMDTLQFGTNEEWNKEISKIDY